MVVDRYLKSLIISVEGSLVSEDSTTPSCLGSPINSIESRGGSKSRSASPSSSRASSDRSQGQDQEQSESWGEVQSDNAESNDGTSSEIEEAISEAEHEFEACEYEEADDSAQTDPLSVLQKAPDLEAILEHLKNQHNQNPTDDQFHTSVTISDDQSVVEKVEERNLLALKDRTRLTTQPEYLQRQTGNHALQDYQMQLMLLEQQNKKRLMMAREEQDMVGVQVGSGDSTSSTVDINLVGPSTKSASASMGKRLLLEVESSDALSDNISEMDVVELQNYIKRLQAKANTLGAGKTEPPASRYQILYRIMHEDGSGGKVKTILSPPFFDTPECVMGQRNAWVLRCRVPVDNFDLYLEQNKDISFLVYKTYIAPQSHRLTDSSMSDNKDITPQINESIRPISPHLIGALELMLKSREEYAEMLQSFKSNSEIHAPYLFMYHHRHALDAIRNGMDALSREQLSLFSGYVAQNYGYNYATADALISQGKIMPEYVNYLFKPGDILVRHRGDEYEGWVARTWPRATH